IEPGGHAQRGAGVAGLRNARDRHVGRWHTRVDHMRRGGATDARSQSARRDIGLAAVVRKPAGSCRHARFCRASGMATGDRSAVRALWPRTGNATPWREGAKGELMIELPDAVKPQTAPVHASTQRPLRILHVLDHSLPLHSGYTFRTLSILEQQRALGWETFQLTGPKQGSGNVREEQIDGWMFYRTPPATGLRSKLPLIQHRGLMKAMQTRLAEVVRSVQPDILHAHSPVLNAFPALSVGHAHHIPVVYEVRAFWEDAAADLGTAREWGARYRLTRSMETRALQRADAVTTICEGLRNDMLGRGIEADKVTVIPNAVNPSRFRVG